MAESTLSLTLSDIESEVGFQQGYGYGTNGGDVAWTTAQQAAITRYVKIGLRQFYFPPPLPGEKASYCWSFMRPVGTVSLLAASTSVALPDDFGGLDGDITLSASGSNSFCPVRVVGEGAVRQRYAEYPSRTGRPEVAAVSPIKGASATEGQRFNLTYWPSPDQAYTASLAYYVLPDMLTTLLPFSYGGMLHCETIRESCLAAAEESGDDTQGVHKAKFFERLAASISADRKYKDQFVGYNGDRSDLRYRDSDPRGWRTGGTATYNGTFYGD